MAVVVFNYAAFIARYPEFTTTVDQTKAGLCFAEAGIYLDNTDSSVVKDVTIRAMLLNMLTAHIAQLGYGSSIKPLNPLVGRVDSATEGSVSVSAKYIDAGSGRAWYDQTQYGAAFWAATARYRSFAYVAGCARRLGP